MLRSMFAAAAVALVALTAGCRMCAHPYDYCGPTFTGEDCQQCMPNARACSILSAGAQPCCDTETVPEIVPVTEQYGGMILETPDGRSVVRHVTEKPEGAVVPAQPQGTAARPTDSVR